MFHHYHECESTVSLNFRDNKISNMLDKEDNKTCKDYSSQNIDDLQSFLIMMTINSIKDNVDCRLPSVTENTDFIQNTVVNLVEQDIYSKDISNILSIKSIQLRVDKETYLLNKYVEKWKAMVQKRKENSMEQRREESINNFVEKLQKKKSDLLHVPQRAQKSKVMVQDYRTYQHRYKVQKHIIALQKAKLEAQNKIIDELKLNRIVDASNQSLEIIREGVRKTYFEMDRKLKPKIQCLSKELKIAEFEEPSMVLHCLKVPQFLRRMEARAREREEKHAIIRERRKQLEEERVRLKQQEELAKAEMDKEEKNRRMKELREKRKREKVENIRKKQYAERMRALTVMADLHYERNLMSKYGIRPFKLLMEIKINNIEKAKHHYNFQIKKNVFLNWMWHTEDMWFERHYKAEEFYRKKCLNRAFAGFKKIHYECVIKRQVAEDYYDLYVTQLVFRKFRQAIHIVKEEYEIKLKKAITYYNNNLVFKTFTCWRTLPALNALKREQEIRKSRWRQKVLLVVPDYRPPEE